MTPNTSTTIDETIRIVLPLQADQDGATASMMRYEADRIASLNSCQVQTLPVSAAGGGAAISLRGRREDVLRARSQLAATRRSQRHTVYYADRMDSPEAIAIAKMTIGEEGEFQTGGSPDQEDIDGDMAVIERAMLSSLAEGDQRHGFCTTQANIPLSAVGRVLGCSGRNRLRVFLQHGVLMDVAGRISEDGNEQCRVYLSAPTMEQLSMVKKDVESESTESPLRQIIPMDERLADWLLSGARRTMLSRVIYKNGTALSLHPDSLVVHGEIEAGVTGTVEEIVKASYQFHVATLWVARKFDDTLTMHLEQASQHSGAEVMQTNRSIELFGTKEQLCMALTWLHSAGIEMMQIKYRLGQREEIRDFISGKKDGKLIKIMKETSVSISLATALRFGVACQIDIEMVAQDVPSLKSALDLLLGEFPAERSFYLAENHHKRLIGHGGKTIQRVMKKYAVYIKFLNSHETAELNAVDAMVMPKSMVIRLPNVLIKTPAKNVDSLISTQEEIYDMAEEIEYVPNKKALKLDRHALLGMKEGDRKQLSVFLEEFNETVDLIVPSTFRNSSIDDGAIYIKASGFHGAIHQFNDAISGDKMGPLLDGLLHHPNGASIPGSPRIQTPPSPTTSHLSGNSSSSSNHSWTTQSPDLFRHFPLTILSPPPSSSSSNSITSPLLTPIIEAKTTTLPGGITGFDPAIGSQRRKNCPWNIGFPRLSLMTVDSLWRADNVEELTTLDWKVISAEHYRRRASSVFRAQS